MTTDDPSRRLLRGGAERTSAGPIAGDPAIEGDRSLPDRAGAGRPVLGPAASFAALQADWQRLAEAAGSVFATWEWASTWWEMYGGRGRLRLLPMRDSGGGVIGILPLYVQSRRPIQVARFVGHEGGDEVGPVCAPEHRASVAAALEAVAATPELGADLVLAESLPAVDWQEHLADAAVLRRTASPVIDCRGLDWPAFLRSLSRGLRREITHGERRLHREHRVGYRVTTDPAQLGPDLDTFFSLHRARFAGTSSLTDREAFYRRFAAVALERGWLRLAILDLDGAPAAARLDLRFGGVHFAYNAGRHQRWNRLSVGLLLRAMTLRDALEDGVAEYRLLRGAEPYKFRLASEDRGSLSVAIPGSFSGRLAVAAAVRLARTDWGRALLTRSMGT